MSVPGASVRRMVNEIAELGAAVSEFAARHGMTVVPAVPGEDSARAVCLSPRVVDLPGFLELARKLGDGALYLRTETFGLDPETGQPEDVPAHLAGYTGQAGELRVAFASAGHGLLHFWEQTAAWYQEWLDSEEDGLLGEDRYEDMRDAEREQSRQADEVAQAIVADPEFRACSASPRRRRRAELLIPEGTDSRVTWEAVDRALKLAEKLADDAYRPIKGQLDELAAEFLASPGWQQSASSAGREEAAGEFLISRADGFCPPTVIRKELYHRARDLSKDRGSNGLFLSGRTHAGGRPAGRGSGWRLLAGGSVCHDPRGFPGEPAGLSLPGVDEVSEQPRSPAPGRGFLLADRAEAGPPLPDVVPDRGGRQHPGHCGQEGPGGLNRLELGQHCGHHGVQVIRLAVLREDR